MAGSEELIKINDETLQNLPQTHFDGQITIVESQHGLQEACDYLLSRPVIGFDTETRPTFTPGPLNSVALLQLSSEDRCFLFRLCRMKLDKAIVQVLESPSVIKVGADVGNDIKALQKIGKRLKPKSFLDLQSIIRQHGVDELSLRKMAAAVLGIRISKAQRLSNWEAAALTPAQQSYAATDAWIAIEIYNKLHGR